MKGWYKLHVTRSYPQASIIKGMLEENNIAVIIFNRMDSSYLNFGDIEIYVPVHFKELSIQLL